jgi:hypothetical protein
MSTFVSTNGQTSAYLAPPFLQDGDIFKEIDTDGWEAAGFALDLRELTGEPASQISGQTITFTLNTLGYAFSDITAEWFIESRADYEDLTGKASLTDPYYLAGNYFGGIFDFGNQSYGQAPPGTGPLSDEYRACCTSTTWGFVTGRRSNLGHRHSIRRIVHQQLFNAKSLRVHDQH